MASDSAVDRVLTARLFQNERRKLPWSRLAKPSSVGVNSSASTKIPAAGRKASCTSQRKGNITTASTARAASARPWRRNQPGRRRRSATACAGADRTTGASAVSVLEGVPSQLPDAPAQQEHAGQDHHRDRAAVTPVRAVEGLDEAVVVGDLGDVARPAVGQL